MDVFVELCWFQNSVKDGDESAGGKRSAPPSMGGELTRFGSKISLISNVDKDEIDISFLNTNTLHHVSRELRACILDVTVVVAFVRSYQ